MDVIYVCNSRSVQGIGKRSADAEPGYYGHGYGYGYGLGYGRGYAYYGGHYLGKREADAEPHYGYRSYYGLGYYGHPYGYGYSYYG